jgi:hypothetical protein
VDCDKGAVREATQRFRELSQKYPQEAVFVAYIGACESLQGRDAPNYIEKQRKTEEGLGDINRALKMLSAGADRNSPQYLDALLVAANTFIHVPSFFNRYDDGRRLVQEILNYPTFDGMAPGYKAAAYMAAALVAQGDGNDGAYRHYLDLTVSSDPDGRDGRFASKLINNP